MTNAKVIFRSATSLTDFLHIFSIAAPLFLIFLGSYVVYENLIENIMVRYAILGIILAAVGLLAPMSHRLKHVEITESGCTIWSAHRSPYEIVFAEIERFVMHLPLGMVTLRIRATQKLPSDSIWFIPESSAGQLRKVTLQEVQSFLDRHIKPAGDGA